MASQSKLKINWFTPLPPARTDIAHYTQRLLPALTKLAEVTLWTEQRTWDRSLEDFAAVRTFRSDRMQWMDLNRADATFYQLGNNPDFHGAIWEVSRAHPGIVVLHDFRLHHFFDGIFRVKRRDLHSYLAVMEKYYGENGRREALICYQRQAVNIDVMAERFPLTEFALEQAVGIVVHTSEAFESLKQDRDCPVAYLPLPFPLTSIKPRERVRFSADSRRRLIVFGYIGRNRRLNSILQALAELDEKDQFRLDVFGSILNDEKELRHRVNTLGLKNLVTFHGFTPQAELDKALAGCDLAINLRFPTMGEASGSQLRIWAHGCPSLVSRVGWYSTLPEDSVAFVRTGENEVSDIKDHLRELLKNPERFAKMGMVGRQLLEGEHSVESYVQGIVKLAEQASQQRARLATLQLAERASRIIHGWIEPEQGTESLRSAAAEVFALTERP